MGAKLNPKRHVTAGIAASIAAYGFNEPPVLDERTGKLVAGHGRIEALALLQAERKPPPARITVKGGDWLVPVLRGIAFRDARDAEAYLLASNRLVELGGWDTAELAPMLDALRKDGDDALASLGWSADEVAKMIAKLAAPDDFPAVDENVPTEHQCPKCHYKWSGGKPAA